MTTLGGGNPSDNALQVGPRGCRGCGGRLGLARRPESPAPALTPLPPPTYIPTPHTPPPLPLASLQPRLPPPPSPPPPPQFSVNVSAPGFRTEALSRFITTSAYPSTLFTDDEGLEMHARCVDGPAPSTPPPPLRFAAAPSTHAIVLVCGLPPPATPCHQIKKNGSVVVTSTLSVVMA